jgi:hypothetical protein
MHRRTPRFEEESRGSSTSRARSSHVETLAIVFPHLTSVQLLKSQNDPYQPFQADLFRPFALQWGKQVSLELAEVARRLRHK